VPSCGVLYCFFGVTEKIIGTCCAQYDKDVDENNSEKDKRAIMSRNLKLIKRAMPFDNGRSHCRYITYSCI